MEGKFKDFDEWLKCVNECVDRLCPETLEYSPCEHVMFRYCDIVCSLRGG